MRGYLHSSNNVYAALENRLRAVPNGGINLTRDDANDRVDFELDVTRVDARIANFAEQGNTDAITNAKAGRVVLTQAQYDNLSNPDNNTLYLIVGVEPWRLSQSRLTQYGRLVRSTSMAILILVESRHAAF